jgi:hypothetical protein
MSALHIHAMWPAHAALGDQDTHMWGEHYWAALYAAAERADSNGSLRPVMLALLTSLGDVLPCTSCRKCIRSVLAATPPDQAPSLVVWLAELEDSVARRQALNPDYRASRRPRALRAPVGVGDPTVARIVSFAVLSAAGRQPAAQMRWTTPFIVFVTHLATLLAAPTGSLLRVFSDGAPQVPRLGYDLYAYLQLCLERYESAQRGLRRLAQPAPHVQPAGRAAHRSVHRDRHGRR